MFIDLGEAGSVHSFRSAMFLNAACCKIHGSITGVSFDDSRFMKSKHVTLDGVRQTVFSRRL